MKYDKRFTKDEFKDEMIKHTKGKPADFSDDQLDDYAEIKARHYEQSMALLDEVREKLETLAKSHPDKEMQKEADFGIKKIDESIASYGQAVFNFNHQWHKDDNV